MPHQIVVNRNPAKGSRWTREEMILCLNLYLKLPYGQLDHRTPAIIKLANLMGRSANTVSIRLNNYSSCDPQIQDSGRTGMEGGRKQCQPYWDEFDGNREALLFESEKILAAYQGTTVEQKYEEENYHSPKNRLLSPTMYCLQYYDNALKRDGLRIVLTSTPGDFLPFMVVKSENVDLLSQMKTDYWKFHTPDEE